MKLYDVPMDTRIRLKAGKYSVPQGQIQVVRDVEINFSHLDGMYSFCTDDDGNVVHLAGYSEVDVVKQDQPR